MAAPVKLNVPVRVVLPFAELTPLAEILVCPDRCSWMVDPLARFVPVILTKTAEELVEAVIGATLVIVAADELALAINVTFSVALGCKATGE